MAQFTDFYTEKGENSRKRGWNCGRPVQKATSLKVEIPSFDIN